MIRIPDAAERARALDPAASFIVQAPAGSGKTELLIQRFLRLLATVDRPEAVLAITFTKKAAGEMRQRVVAALRAAAGPPPAKEHEALTWELARAVRARSEEFGWDLYSNPSRLEIRTIDSLCMSLVQRMPWLSRLGAPPEIAEDASGLYADAARRTIEELETGERGDAVAALLEHVDNDFPKLQELLAKLLAKRDQWLRHVAGAVDENTARQALEASLRNAIADGIAKARAATPPEFAGEIVAVAAEAGRNLLSSKPENPGAACAGMSALPDDPERWVGIVNTLLTKEDGWRVKITVANGFPPKSAIKSRGEALLGALAGCEAFRLAMADLRWLPAPHFSEEQWSAMRALLDLLPLAVAQLQVRFREAGQADFVEIGLAAQRAMGDAEAPTDLAFSLDLRIQHLLVDEFQDTSVSQFSLIEKLIAGWQPGDGRTLFVVGDPMQSIYRFREAQVGLFLKAWQDGIGGIPLETLRLEANFRSDAQLVEWVNATLPEALASAEDIPTGAIRFAPSMAVKAASPGAAVTIHPFIGRNDAAEAEQVAAIAREARERGRKVAILVRARSHLAAIVPALRDAGLSFRAVEIHSLATQPVIHDLVSLTRALLHPADRIAWLAVLRAPWCGLLLPELYELTADAPAVAVWDLISDDLRVARLGASRERVQRFRAAIQLAVADRASALRARVEGAWLSLGGPASVAEPAGRENAAAFFELLEAMDDGAPVDPVKLAARIEKLYANPDPAADDSIQVMSIHKAKGLEFEAVIVPGLGRQTKSDDARLMLWLERPRAAGAPDLLMSPIHATGANGDPIYGYLRKIEALKAANETGRLLYVAATRAKSELHLMGHVDVDNQGAPKNPDGSSLLGRMWNTARAEFAQVTLPIAPTAPPGASAPDPGRAPRTIERFTLEWSLPAPPPAAVPEREKEPAADQPAVTFRWVGDTLRHVGTVVHQLLRRIAEDGADGWNAERIETARGPIRGALLSLGVSPAEIGDAVSKVVDALTGALADHRGAWVLRGGEFAACEYPLAGFAHGQIVNARVDRTFVDSDGVRWIVDYKTSTHEGSDVEAFLDAERERYRGQLETYRRLFTAMEGRSVRTALYFPLLAGWREVEAGAAEGREGNRQL
jgi:ATP-dependent helicase/nuclease subunit A